MTHTKGPWEVGTVTATGRPGIIAEDGPVVAELTQWTSAGMSELEVILANARLIASAPELLEACEIALSVFAALGHAEKGISKVLSRAIAKAEGRADQEPITVVANDGAEQSVSLKPHKERE